MPLSSKGQEIMAAMKHQYGSKKGESVFYASKNSGKISGVDSPSQDSRQFFKSAVKDALSKGMTADKAIRLALTKVKHG